MSRVEGFVDHEFVAVTSTAATMAQRLGPRDDQWFIRGNVDFHIRVGSADATTSDLLIPARVTHKIANVVDRGKADSNPKANGQVSVIRAEVDGRVDMWRRGVPLIQ